MGRSVRPTASEGGHILSGTQTGLEFTAHYTAVRKPPAIATIAPAPARTDSHIRVLCHLAKEEDKPLDWFGSVCGK